MADSEEFTNALAPAPDQESKHPFQELSEICLEVLKKRNVSFDSRLANRVVRDTMVPVATSDGDFKATIVFSEINKDDRRVVVGVEDAPSWEPTREPESDPRTYRGPSGLSYRQLRPAINVCYSDVGRNIQGRVMVEQIPERNDTRVIVTTFSFGSPSAIESSREYERANKTILTGGSHTNIYDGNGEEGGEEIRRVLEGLRESAFDEDEFRRIQTIVTEEDGKFSRVQVKGLS